eukprot:COSAG02_NODE_6354_length_3628_cov_2295.351374_1_plen_98_part_10
MAAQRRLNALSTHLLAPVAAADDDAGDDVLAIHGGTVSSSLNSSQIAVLPACAALRRVSYRLCGPGFVCTTTARVSDRGLSLAASCGGDQGRSLQMAH